MFQTLRALGLLSNLLPILALQWSPTLIPVGQTAEIPLTFVQPLKIPNYDTDVLKPLHAAQQRLVASCDAQGGSVRGASCIQPPKPSPTPPPVPEAATAPPTMPTLPSESIQAVITTAALAHGVDPSWLLRVARCESGFNIYAHNPSGATGLLQFMPSTFYGNGGTNLYSASDQANIAAKMFAEGQSGQWVCR